MALFMAPFNGELSETAEMPKSRRLVKTVMVQKAEFRREEFGSITNVSDTALRK